MPCSELLKLDEIMTSCPFIQRNTNTKRTACIIIEQSSSPFLSSHFDTFQHCGNTCLSVWIRKKHLPPLQMEFECFTLKGQTPSGTRRPKSKKSLYRFYLLWRPIHLFCMPQAAQKRLNKALQMYGHIHCLQVQIITFHL